MNEGYDTSTHIPNILENMNVGFFQENLEILEKGRILLSKYADDGLMSDIGKSEEAKKLDNQMVGKKLIQGARTALQGKDDEEIINNLFKETETYITALQKHEKDKWETIIGKTARYYRK